jgi:hypothetical protein
MRIAPSKDGPAAVLGLARLVRERFMTMKNSQRLRFALMMASYAVGGLAITGAPARADEIQTYITNFTKDNNIYTNLNEQFPNTGAGVPGSGVGVPNASYLYNPATYTSPNIVAGSDLANNGINFNLTSNSTGQDFMQLSTSQIVPPTPSLTLSVGVNNVTSFYLLMGAYFGTTVNVTFTGVDGSTETFNDLYLPDFNGGAGSGGINNCFAVNGSSTNNACDQTALIVQDVGAGGTGNSSNGAYNYYDLTELSFDLDSTLSDEELVSAQITTNGNSALLLGATTLSEASTTTSVPEPLTLSLFGAGLVGAVVARRRKAKA